MELKQLITEIKTKYGYNNSQIADMFGVIKGTVSRWLNGSVKTINQDTIQKLNDLFHYDIGAVLKGNVTLLKRPLLGVAKAGYNLFLDSNYTGEIEVTEKEYYQGDYFLKVTGDSMKDSGIINGGYIYVKQCTQVNNGDISVVIINDEVTIKKYYHLEERVKLVTSNPEYPDRTFNMKEVEELPVKVIGKVIFSKNEYN